MPDPELGPGPEKLAVSLSSRGEGHEDVVTMWREKEVITQGPEGPGEWVGSSGSMEGATAGVEFSQESSGGRPPEQGTLCKGPSQSNTVCAVGECVSGA